MRVLVFQHINVEHPGILRNYLTVDDIPWDVVEWDAGDTPPALDAYDALWVMGGPMDVWEEDELPWLSREKESIRKWVSTGKPFLGICLGHQLLADALGGSVAPMARAEVGVMAVELSNECERDPLFQGLETQILSLQWHGSEVVEMPANAINLAASPACACQAFRVGSAAYGLQFHVEATAETVREWGAVTAYADSLQQTMGQGAIGEFDRAVQNVLPQFNRLSRRLYDNFQMLF
jgi:GMP synthase-like glutamine amidotransferase